MTYYTIKAHGKTEEWTPAKGKPTLAEMQGIVGGYIERVTVKGGELWVNEDGISRGLPVNHEASNLAGQLILGDVLFCKRKVMVRKPKAVPVYGQLPSGRKFVARYQPQCDDPGAHRPGCECDGGEPKL